MVFLQTGAVVFERVEGPRGNHARLPHSAPEHFAKSARFSNGFFRATNRGPDGCSQALGKTYAHGIERPGQVAFRGARRGRRVPEARTVEVHAYPACRRDGRNLHDVSLGEDPTSGSVVRI